MPDATTIAKTLATVPIIPGALMILMGLGLAPLDEGMAAAASPFLTPLGFPTKPFMLILGPCKILGGLSLWGIGPMPEMVGRIGLMFSAACGAYGHYKAGDPFIPPLMYIGVLGSLYYLDKSVSKGKKA